MSILIAKSLQHQVNWLKVHRKCPLREEKSSLFAPLDSINKEDEELGSLEECPNVGDLVK